MYCKNLSKSLKGNLRCKYYKKDISSLDTCKSCLNFILAKNKPIKKISKKRIFVLKETYDKVLNRDKQKCRLLNKDCNGGLELHHIVYRSENKNLINEPDNCIMLCNYHHKLVHSNKHYWQPKLKQIIGGKNEN